MPHVLPDWTPSADAVAGARITGFAAYASELTGRDLTTGYHDLWRWSVEDLDGFWSALWDHLGLPPRPAGAPALAGEDMPGAVWFPGTVLNYTREVFRGRPDHEVAVIAVEESGRTREVTWAELRAQVASLAATLTGLGVRPGDRVAGYLPNGVEAVVAFLATASLGAVWAMCGLDYGVSAALARLAQLRPAVLVAAASCVSAGRRVDRGRELGELRAGLPGLAATVLVGDATLPGTLPWAEAAGRTGVPLTPLDVPFDHPLWVLFSSGTTGRPKGIVHGHGGVVLEHLKTTALHFDLRAGDRMFWYTSPSWMMWNYLVGALLAGVAIVCYDGSPAHPAPDRLFDIAARTRVQVLGTSPGYLAACQKAGADLGAHDLEALRCLAVTGSTFPADLHRWAVRGLGSRVPVVTTSGGTDVVTAFAGGVPTVPVWAGELSAPCLGVALAAYDASGAPVEETVGELVVRRPMPSMPLRFWDDPGDARLREAYFETFPGVWRHGDWVTITGRGSVVIHGRSDATLNRRGVRMGSGDIYAPVEELPQVAEALVIGLEEPGGGYWMPLFVTTVPGVELDEALREAIRTAIRTHASPRHVPDDIIAAPGVPHTRTGKKLEVPVKRILRGDDLASVVDPAGIDRPDLLTWYQQIGAHRRATIS
ncbi:acetoacetyl-CoA synthetase [Sphaerisporangium krabiense]|uniref:Acetoacetyl-CoA synthetase n=1 Tax=Sphaerisporangium krabiense TaxID=763782 RepID=A0A7W8ZCR8_9ACTN|nr:acetoacetate--CoA ligase [Sphaerisporangium krabiense]MBB5631541.1 acetoacetyl-CoA synthetase [Sphaerisporangium krabiense]GII60955.1 acetoacetyl-CoA synthetase [Sphaerisporangium krabiense]